MRSVIAVLTCLMLPAFCGSAVAQVELKGRLWAPRLPGSEQLIPQTAIRGYATQAGSQDQSMSTRTWEMEPAGWSYMTGGAGRYAMLFSTPGLPMRPILQTNIFTRPGEVLDFPLTAKYTLGLFDDSSWDPKPAKGYYQTFTADGTSVTSVGFKFATDGVDGEGPLSQNVLVSIHKQGPGTPDTWPRVGPVMVALDVDSGGPKNYAYSVGWNSGEVPTTPGQTYAVYLRPETRGNSFQTFWSKEDVPEVRLYRVGDDSTGWQSSDMFISVGSDNDNLFIPMNKRVHKQFGEFGGFGTKWSQTYVAKGRSLAGVIMDAAASGVQPDMNRQKAILRVREGGPSGPVVGIEKIAIGNATWTGDSSWGSFGAAFLPGEVPLEPGKTYALEFETLENYESVHDFMNFKGMPSDDRPGFNPYIKMPPDEYPHGTAYKAGTRMDFDLDMQVIEYAHNPKEWDKAVEPRNLLANGRMNMGTLSSSQDDPGNPIGWKPFETDPSTQQVFVVDPNDLQSPNRILRVWGGGSYGNNPLGGNNKTADGGYVQSVDGLERTDTYRISGQVRCSWATDISHQVYVGYDPTGQTEDSTADTIVWEVLPSLSGVWMDYLSAPVRPAEDSISIWLRGSTSRNDGFPFKADFDNFGLRKVMTGIPSRAQ